MNPSNKPKAAGAAKSSRAPGSRPAAKAPSARSVALHTLTEIEQKQAYSNLALNHALQQYRLSRVDSGFATELVYGTVQRLNTIDYFLGRFVAKGMGKLESWVRQLLRMSFYQLYYLDRVPEHAVVNEAVLIAKQRGHAGIAGMVNGVLRNVIRNRHELVLPAELSEAERIALQHSHPLWLVDNWLQQFGAEDTERMCAANNMAPKTVIRVNSLLNSRQQLLEQMEGEGMNVHPSTLARSGIVVENGGNMAFTHWYESGELSIQDESSMLVAELVDPQPGMRVLDCCAAPGGKSAHMAELMGDSGSIDAVDIHPHKASLMQEQFTRLNLQAITIVVNDAMLLAERYPPDSFDRILLDAPCSGLGVIRRKPDLKWRKNADELRSIVEIQYKLLVAVQSLLKPGGILVYSTCTVEKMENEWLVQRFLQQYPQFVLDPAGTAAEGLLRIMPYEHLSDGFFIARMRKAETSQ